MFMDILLRNSSVCDDSGCIPVLLITKRLKPLLSLGRIQDYCWILYKGCTCQGKQTHHVSS